MRYLLLFFIQAYIIYDIGRISRHSEWRECVVKFENKKDIWLCALEKK